MTGPDDSDLAFCRDRLGASGSSLSLSLLFAPVAVRPTITALHAVLGEVRSVAFEVTHPETAAAKLAWWEQALAQAREGTPQHPAIRALKSSGGLNRLPGQMVSAFVGAVGRFSLAEPFADHEALNRELRAIGRLAARLEHHLEPGSSEKAGDTAGEVEAHAWCLRHPVRLRAGQSPWLPQDLQARYGLALTHEGGDADPEAVRRALTAHVERALDVMVEPAGVPGRHLYVLGAISRLRLDQVRGGVATALNNRVRPADAWFAWRAARRHARLQRSAPDIES
ncbi:MAG: squalene/phytoene synthase family protein [Xanthomonadales bacterium]|nr:squalene/phytoene synthase family protein [Xanthomonadales bacterium]